MSGVIRHIDGTLIFKGDNDVRNEAEIAAALEKAFNCKLNSFGRLAPIDWWAERYDRVIGFIEAKARNQASADSSTVIISVRKWIALLLAQTTGAPSIYVVRFTDGLRWIRVSDIDPSAMRIGGRRRREGSVNDIEPVIDIPIESMHPVKPPSDTFSA